MKLHWYDGSVPLEPYFACSLLSWMELRRHYSPHGTGDLESRASAPTLPHSGEAARLLYSYCSRGEKKIKMS